MSVIFATVIVPAWTHRHSSPKRGWSQTVKLMLGFNVVYMILYLTVWQRLLWSG